MTAEKEITLTAGPLRLAALESGSPDGFPVLALHGWMDNAASFSPLAALLRGIHLVSLDFSGHGLSAHRTAACVPTFLDWVPEVLGAADSLGWERFGLLTHSMGAAVGILFAGAFPEKVERLVVLDGFGPLADEPEAAPARLATALAAERTLTTAPEPTCRRIEDAIRARRRNGSDLDEDSARRLVERGTQACADGGVRFSHDPRLRLPSRSRFTEEQVLAFIRAITCPVLGIRPRGGWPAPEFLLERRFAAFRQARLLEIEGGHHVHLTHPERVAEAVQAFLAR